MSKVYRNTSTPEGKAFWEPSALAAEVETWPDWKRAGINVTPHPTVDSNMANETATSPADDALREAIEKEMAFVLYKNKAGELSIGFIDAAAVEEVATLKDEEGYPRWTSAIVGMVVSNMPPKLAEVAMKSATDTWGLCKMMLEEDEDDLEDDFFEEEDD